ncbi:hypothetical protein I4U23_013706 [Adineta vaga]|nr:hypothetical protein I4U23_013706 [Adineta vaga]
MAQCSPDILGIDDREKQMEIIKNIRNEISKLEQNKEVVDDSLQELLNQQSQFIDDEQQFLTNLSDLKEEFATKKTQTKLLNKEIDEARKQQEELYDQLYQYNELPKEKSSTNEFNVDLTRNTIDESCLDEQHQLFLEQEEDIEKQIENYEYKINIYQDDFENNKERIKILQSNMEHLEQDLKDCQKKKELKEKELSKSRENLIAKQNDQEELRILREKFAQLSYSKTLLTELSNGEQKDVDQISTRFKSESEEIDSRRKLIANEIQSKEKEIKSLEKDSESSTTTTIDFTTNLTVLSIEDYQDSLLTQNEQDIQSDLNLMKGEKGEMDERMKTDQTKYNDLQNELKRIENALEKSGNDLQKQLKTNRDKLKSLSNDHQKLLKTSAEDTTKLRQAIEEPVKAHLDLCNLLKKEKESYQQQEKVKHAAQIAEQNLKAAKDALASAQEASDTMDRFVKANREAQVVGDSTKKRMLVARKVDVDKTESDLKRNRELVEKLEKDNETAKSIRIQAEKNLKDLEKQIPIEQQNVVNSKSKLNSKEQEIKQVEEEISKNLVDIETAEQNREKLNDEKSDQSNQMYLHRREMELDQHRLGFLSNKIAQYEDELKDLKNLKEDLSTQRNKKQKQYEQFIQSKNTSTKNKIRTIDWSKKTEIRRIENEIFKLKAKDNKLNGRKETLQRLSRIILDKNNDLKKALQDDTLEFAKIDNQMQTLEKKFPLMNIDIKFAEKNIEAEAENQTELETYQRTQTMELVFRYYELLNAELTEYQLKNLIESAKSQLNKRQADVEQFKGKLNKNEEESQNVRTKIRELTQNIDQENQPINDIKYTKAEIEFTKERISAMNKYIDQLQEEFMKIKPELDKILTGLKDIYGKLCDCARQLADILPTILDKQLEISDFHHKIAGKQDSYRNFMEELSKFTTDVHIHFYPEPTS